MQVRSLSQEDPWEEEMAAHSSILVVVEWLRCVWLLATPGTAACQACLSFTISRSLPGLTSIVLMMPSNHIMITPFSSCAQSFPASGSFLVSQLFAPGGQSIGILNSILTWKIPQTGAWCAVVHSIIKSWTAEWQSAHTVDNTLLYNRGYGVQHSNS